MKETTKDTAVDVIGTKSGDISGMRNFSGKNRKIWDDGNLQVAAPDMELVSTDVCKAQSNS